MAEKLESMVANRGHNMRSIVTSDEKFQSKLQSKIR